MELKLPFKLDVKYLIRHEDVFEGKVVFHNKEYSIKIHAQNNEKIIRVPFSVIGITDDEILVRVSTSLGTYVQDYMRFKGESELIDITSDIIFNEITNNEIKFDIMEIFVK